jgi:hypothetical protein
MTLKHPNSGPRQLLLALEVEVVVSLGDFALFYALEILGNHQSADMYPPLKHMSFLDVPN